MLAMAWHRLWRQGVRTVVLGFAIVLAATGFTVLTASSNAARLETIGVVRKSAGATYDILVRPKGSRSELEKSGGFVQPGFLTGIYGGITLQQWHQIQKIDYVQIAAPIAMLGYAYPSLEIPVDTTGAWSRTGTSVARVDVTWKGDNGLTRTQQSPDFAAITDQVLKFNNGASANQGIWLYRGRAGSEHDVCPQPIGDDERPERRVSQLLCFSRNGGGMGTRDVGEDYRRAGLRGVLVRFPLSYVVAAVDPASEDALVGLDKAVTSGRSLSGATLKYPGSIDGKGVPVLVSDRVGVRETATITVSSLAGSAGRAVLEGKGAAALKRVSSRRSSRFVVTAKDAQQQLLRAFRTTKPVYAQQRPTKFLPGEITTLGQVGPPAIARGANGLRVKLHPSPATGRSYDVVSQAPASDEPMARDVTSSEKEADEGELPTPTTLRLRGVFDPSKLTSISDLTDQALAGYATAPTEGANATSRRSLGNSPLKASTNLGGFVQPPPTMITTLGAIPQLTQGWSHSTEAAPISAIRVRVTGASVYDETSRERIRLTAQRIQQQTGLAVDITTGSSAGKKAIALPAGKHGRPELALSQWWVKKGVATQILSAVDKKSVALFCLVLLVAALSVANAAVAAVRTRRTELGVLASLGWQRADLFRSVLYELGLVALVSGLLSVGLALGLGWALGSHVGLLRAILALPAAFAVAVVAGAVPAMLAARADPMDAIRPVVNEPAKPRHPRGSVGLAALNLALSRTRTALAALGLLIAVATTAMLLAIVLGFQGAVVGTILGDTVSVQTRGADYAATIATLLLACLGVTNVMYLNIRDRGAELATLRAVGWREHDLDWLITVEGTLLALVGTVPGALLGLAGAWLLVGGFAPAMVLGALIAWAVATVLAGMSAYAATVFVRRLPTSDLLTE
ncbi:ABC transporter permease [Nocardioides terrisoli]|uniref:ABC transporter permease n=1 Tax=Nocardioides terrisoli TaxID=3388267 RepID=UPI00287B9290|nr:ABC transporter permease [Nocardioides marmorisolisilvae]